MYRQERDLDRGILTRRQRHRWTETTTVQIRMAACLHGGYFVESDDDWLFKLLGNVIIQSWGEVEGLYGKRKGRGRAEDPQRGIQM